MPAAFPGPPLQVEHVRPLKHDGGDEPTNLALACHLCNLHKGMDIAGYDPQTGAAVLLFNPRTMVWSEHLAADDGEVAGLTLAGRTTAHLLRMNADERVTRRALLAEAGEWP